MRAEETLVNVCFVPLTNEVCALLGEGIINVRALRPARSAGLGTIVHLTYVGTCVGALRVRAGCPPPTRADRDLPALKS